MHALQVHLHDEQFKTFENGCEQDAVEEGAPETSLTAWLKCVQSLRPEDRKPIMNANGDVTWTAKYCDWPERYSFANKKWKKRTSKSKEFTIGRIHNVHPNAGERFYLRLILHNVVANDLALEDVESETDDAFTLEALKYFEGAKNETFKAAAMRRNLLQDDGEWEAAMNDADLTATAFQIRELYLYIVLFNQPDAPQTLFENHWPHMAEDVQHRLRKAEVEFLEWELRARVLCIIEESLLANGKNLQDMNLSLTASERAAGERLGIEVAHATESKEVRDELIAPCDRNVLESKTNTAINSLLEEQKAILTAVLDALRESRGRCIFVDAPGGTGKTFTFNVILGAVRLQGEIALAVASSGIAAILLDSGRTFHARFKASREPAEGQMLSISGQTALADLLRRAKVIIWDEAAMGNKYSLEALDASLKDFMQSEDPFGGKIVILGNIRPFPLLTISFADPFMLSNRFFEPFLRTVHFFAYHFFADHFFADHFFADPFLR